MKHFAIILLSVVATITHAVAQDLIVPKQGNPITVYIADVSNAFIYYTINDNTNAPLLRISKDSVLMVRNADGTALDLDFPFIPTKPTTNYPIIEEADIHGSLIAKGNRVYIPTDSKNVCERAGQECLKQEVQEWGYWIVVDELEQSHFVLQYALDSKGKDYSILIIRSRKLYKTNPSADFNNGNIGFGVAKCRSNDSDSTINHTYASLFFNYLKKVITDPDYDKNLKRYTNAFFDRDNAYEYFYHYISNMTAEGENNVTYSRVSIPYLYHKQ